MTDKSEKLIERIKKVLALARNGVGGERENAQSQLESMLKKHGLTMADIEGEENKLVEAIFTYKTFYEKRLIGQIICAVLDKFGNYVYTRGKSSNKLWCEMTVSQEIECKTYFEILSKALENHFDLSYAAFVKANDLYPKSVAPKDDFDLTPEQRARQFKISMMAQGVDKSQINKQIEGK